MFDANGFNSNIHGMRGLAALLVFMIHIIHNMEYYLIETGLATALSAHELKTALSFGSLGVELFFVISGYLITSSLLRHKDIVSFLIDRAIRIYPVFLAIHIPFFIIMPLLGWKWLADVTFFQWLLHFISNALFLPGVFDLPIVQTNAWTLSYEFLFYLISCTVYIVSIRFDGCYKYALQILIVVPFVFIFPRSVYFLLGAISYLVLVRKPDFLSQYNFFPAFLFVLLMLILGPLRYNIETAHSAIHSTDMMTKIAVIPMFFFFIETIRSRGVVSVFLRTRLFQFFGKISYSLYLWHAVFLFLNKRFFVGFLDGNAGIDSLMVVFVSFVFVFVLVVFFFLA